MKKTASLFILAAIFAACNTKTDSPASNSTLVPFDSSHGYQNSTVTDTAQTVKAMPAARDTAVVSTTTTVTKTPVAHSRPITPVKPHGQAHAPSQTANTASSGSGTTNPTTTPAPVASVPAPVVAPEPEKKRGISNSAKGAIIGTGAGAVTGGIIGKNAKGALIGGALGAAGGYIIGRSKDKKDGRVKKDTLQ